jgi:uncharacterized protein (TIGR03086 family)
VTDSLALLERALDQVSGLLGEARPEQAADPTPCPSWDVATLARHIVFDLDQFTATAHGERPDWSAQPPPIEGDWRVAFDRGAQGLVKAWQQAGDLDEIVTLPMGEVPRSFLVNQQLAEFAVHAWDLSRAIGHSGQLDEEIAGTALAWGSKALKPEYRGADKSFGVEVAAPADAPATNRLVAFFGRSPGWPAA